MKRIRLLISAIVLGVSALLPLLAPGIAHAVVHNCAWTGATNSNFNTAGNWTGCNSTVPQATDNLVFDVTSLTSSKTLNNDIVGLAVGTITFQGTNASHYTFTLTGNALNVSGNVIGTTSSTIDLGLTLGADIAFTGSSVNFGDGSHAPVLNLNGHNLTNGSGSDTVFTQIQGTLSGTGNIAVLAGTSVYLQAADNSAWTGGISVASGASVNAFGARSLGSDSSTVAVASGGNLSFCGLNGATVAQNITLAGTGISNYGAISANTSCGFGGGGTDTSPAKVTLAGTITLTANATVLSSDVTTITGPLTGSFTITVATASLGTLVINSSNNTSLTPNGTNGAPAQTISYDDNDASTTIDVTTNVTASVNGVRGDTTVEKGGILKGTGTVGALTVFTGGIVAPGHSPGCLSTGALTLLGTYQVELGGTTACTEYDQLKVTGAVDLTGSTLQIGLYNNFKPKKGQTFTIIDNDAVDPIGATFTGLAEGATVTVGGYIYKISYIGGTGNDVVLTVQNVPASPDTGLALIKANPLVSAAIMIAAAGGIVFASRRAKHASHRR